MAPTDAAIKALKPRQTRYVVSDGERLCREVFPTGSKIWRYRYRLRGKPETVTVGPYPTVTLKDARERRNLGLVIGQYAGPGLIELEVAAIVLRPPQMDQVCRQAVLAAGHTWTRRPALPALPARGPPAQSELGLD